MQHLSIDIAGASPVSALLNMPDEAWAGYVFAHGAGAGMEHSFMTGFANGLAERRIATLRYQFPYMEQGSKRPDTPKVAHAAVRAAVAQAAQLLPGLPLFAGGKSFGGRMTSQAQALSPLPGVRGLVFVGFPLHPAGKPADERAAHLFEIDLPMLFLQGTRDELAAWSCCSRCWCASANGQRWRCSRMPIIRSTSGRAAAAPMARRWRRCLTQW
jgi:uncharacterized protein